MFEVNVKNVMVEKEHNLGWGVWFGKNVYLNIIQTKENPLTLTFDCSMIFSKSDLSDCLRKKLCVSTKIIFVPIDYPAKFQIFKLSFSGSE